MGLIGKPWFWLAAAIIAVAMQWTPPIPKARWLGVLNLGALVAVVGPEPAFAAIAATLGVWALGCAAASRRGMWVGWITASILILVALVLYKLAREGVLSVCAADAFCAGDIALTALTTLSFSYAALRCLDYLAAVRDGEPATDPLALPGYLFPFHMLVAGPIAAYREFRTLEHRPSAPATFTHVLDCANMVATGLVFKLVVAEGLRIFVGGIEITPLPQTWWAGSYLLVYLYFDFAGYSLIALGIGRLCGIPTPVNFDKPFLSTTLTEFWTRWHISLGAFVRNNLYMPLQIALVRRFGTRRSAVIAFFTTSASFTFVGLWHHLSPMFLVWGFSLGLVMALEKPVRDRMLANPRWRSGWRMLAAKVLGPGYVFVLVSASLQLVAQEVM